MKKTYVLALTLVTVTGWIAILNIVLVHSLAGERDLEVPFKNAATEAKRGSSAKGCDTIPYSDLNRDCEDAGKLRERWCKSPYEPRNCDDQKNPLTQAIIKKDKAKIAEIRKTLLARQTHGESCTDARVDVQHTFKQADGRVESDKRTFESKRSSAKNEEMKGFFTDMIGYADTILDYYYKQERGHVDQITQMRTLVTGCKEQVDKADDALR